MRKNKNRLMKILLYCLVVCGIIVISLRLYTIYTICISPDSFFEPNLPREELILVTGKSLSNVLMSVELTSDKAAALLEASRFTCRDYTNCYFSSCPTHLPEKLYSSTFSGEYDNLVTGLRYSLLYSSYCAGTVYHLRSGFESGKFISEAHTVSIP